MPNQRWKYVNIPEAMWSKIQKLIIEHPDLGFKSVADFVASAVRTDIHYQTKRERE